MSKTARAQSRLSNEFIFIKKEKELKNKNSLKSPRIFSKTSNSFFIKQNKENSKNYIFSLLSTSTTNLLKDITNFNSLQKNILDEALFY